MPDGAVGTDIMARSSYMENLDHRVKVAIAWVGEAYVDEEQKSLHPMLTDQTWQEMIEDDDLISKVSRYN